MIPYIYVAAHAQFLNLRLLTSTWRPRLYTHNGSRARVISPLPHDLITTINVCQRLDDVVNDPNSTSVLYMYRLQDLRFFEKT
jgi:hypothetical protein